MNKKCVALDRNQYKQSISLLKAGYNEKGVLIRPNYRIATICVIQATLGLRLGDTLALRMSSFVRDGQRYRLDIIEEKTGKIRVFTVPIEIYLYISEYAVKFGIRHEAKLFDISKRQVERHLNKIFSIMGLPTLKYGSHSYRKFFATNIYLNNSMNIELVRILLNHSSVMVTQRYIGIGSQMVEEAIGKTVQDLV